MGKRVTLAATTKARNASVSTLTVRLIEQSLMEINGRRGSRAGRKPDRIIVVRNEKKLTESSSVSPTVLRSGPYRFFFFASDRQEPPHIHVKRDDKLAKFWLSPVREAYNYGFSRRS